MSSKRVKEVPLFPEVSPKREHRKKRSNSSVAPRTVDGLSHPLSANASSTPDTPQPVQKSRRSSSAVSSARRSVCTHDIAPPQKKVSFPEPLEQPPTSSVSHNHDFAFPSTLSSNVPFGRSLDYHFSSSPDLLFQSIATTTTGWYPFLVFVLSFRFHHVRTSFQIPRQLLVPLYRLDLWPILKTCLQIRGSSMRLP